MGGPSSSPPPLDPEGERLWNEVEAVFGDPARHDRFVQHCTTAGALPAAARRYRDWLEAHPGDELARKMLQRITFLAMQPLAQPPRPPKRRMGKGALLFVVVAAALIGAVLGAVFGPCGGGR